MRRKACKRRGCAVRFQRSPWHPAQLYCCRECRETERRDRRSEQRASRRAFNDRTPRFVRELAKEEPIGRCIFGCGARVTRIMCKDVECRRAYDRLYSAERRAS